MLFVVNEIFEFYLSDANMKFLSFVLIYVIKSYKKEQRSIL